MTDDERDAYDMETALFARPGSSSPVTLLRAALQAAEELESKGIDWADAWRRDEYWSRLARIAMCLDGVNAEAKRAFNADSSGQWRDQRRRRHRLTIVR